MAAISETIEVTVPEGRARRLRLYTIAAIGVVAGLTLITTTQTWWTVHLATQSLAIAGTVAAPALTALTLCALVLAAALALAGPVFRLILGVLQLLVSFTIVFSSILSLARPDQPSESAVQTATGIAGSSSIDALIRNVTLTPWGFIGIVLGVIAFLIGVWLLLTFRLWPVPSRKYQAVRFEVAGGPRDAVIDWDALSDGADPTAEPGPASGGKPVK
jgi:Tryptophan-associated transmembrane protein (Trp_oprn_chp)